jgi:parallel beta-helix repeat protein
MINIQSNIGTNKMTAGLIIIVLAMLTAHAIPSMVKINAVAEINPPPPGEGQIHYHNGDWIIETGDNVYRGNQTIVLKGNLTVLGGTITFQNVTLLMNSTEDGEFEINVTANGRFLVYNSNITAFDSTIPVVLFPGEPDGYTTYGLRYKFKVYGNMTIENSDVSYMWGLRPSRLTPVFIGGIEIHSDNVTINKSHVFNSEGYGISCYQASPIITNSIISHNTNATGIYLKSSGGLIAYNNITSNEYGIRCHDSSSPTITHNSITSNVYDGISLSESHATVTNNYISNNGLIGDNDGIRIGSSSPYIANNTVLNNKYGISVQQAESGGLIINNTVKNNVNWGVWVTGSASPTLINCTLENNNYDFWAWGGTHTTMINTTFDDTKIWLDSSASLTVKNYLDVLVLDAVTAPIPGADIEVTDNGNPIYQTPGFGGSDPQTGGDGLVRWIVVTDRIYYGSSTPTENITTAEVSYPSKTFVDNPRDVNMYTSHTEIFIEVGGVLLPDLTLTANDITFIPPSPVKDKTLVTIGAMIHNIGLKEGRIVVVRFYNGVPSPANLINETQIPSIPALGGIGWAEVDWNATPVGTHNIYIVVDPDYLIAESNESNNIANKTIDVGVLLYEGWNLISIPFIQPDTNLDIVLNSIKGSYDAVQWYNVSDNSDPWKHSSIKKPSHLNDLDDIHHMMGFWIHITQPGGVLFQYTGITPIVNQTITLHPGWNLVGYPSLISYNRTQGLNNITFGKDVDSIWTYNAATKKWEELSPSDYFEVGRGYWVHSKVTKTWIVPL